MALDTGCVGTKTDTHVLDYDWKTLATYALGIGARRDELAYLYEGTAGGMLVYPTFAVVPTYPVLNELLSKTGGDMAMVVHGSQSIRLSRKIPSEGRLLTTGSIDGVYDMKKLAQVILKTRTTLEGSQETLFETTWGILYRSAGGFGGPRPPSVDSPSIPKDRAPDWVIEHTTSPEQALLYRLSGDRNPLHADPAFAEAVGFAEGPILHGLCTYGFVCRALVQGAAGGDPGRVKGLTVQFRKPVWPGDTIVTSGWAISDTVVALQASVRGKPDPVLTGAWAELVPA